MEALDALDKVDRNDGFCFIFTKLQSDLIAGNVVHI